MEKRLYKIYEVFVLFGFSAAVAFASYILYREAALKFILRGGAR